MIQCLARFQETPRRRMARRTVSGLNRYDGYQFRQLRHDPRDAWSIVDNYIEQIFEGPGKRMWVESRTGRFNIYDFDHDRFQTRAAQLLRAAYALGVADLGQGPVFRFMEEALRRSLQ